ncbi:MAG: chromosomal replication initiator protein DnaA [Deltaproteobacteria bacterium]|nr:chromosomal replication initiator protein DnaA [Deltaproteobacteria bacterium]
MGPKKKDIWHSITQILSAKLPKSEFDMWFCRASLKDLTEEKAVISVSNKYVANWLHERYLTHLEDSFHRVVDCRPEIHFAYPASDRSSKKEVKKPAGADPLGHKHNVNPSMTFANYLRAESNSFALSSAMGLAQELSESYNPLYIYSDLSLGKTHLLHAIGNHVMETHPHRRVLYVPSNRFIGDFSLSGTQNRILALLENYTTLDILLFDDIQELEGKRYTQKKLLFIFNKLHQMKSHMVITGTKLPKDLREINPELKSRIGAGVMAEISRPEQDTKIRLIRETMAQDGISIADDVVFYLASSHLEFKGLIHNITRLKALASMNNGPISISIAKTLIEDSPPLRPSLEHIKMTTSAYFGISASDLVSSRKNRAFSYPRHVAMYLARKYTTLSYKEIGHSLGHKDHSTVLYGIRRIERSRDRDRKVLSDLKQIENIMNYKSGHKTK